MVWLTRNIPAWSLVAALLVSTAGATSTLPQDADAAPDAVPLGPVPPCLTPPTEAPGAADATVPAPAPAPVEETEPEEAPVDPVPACLRMPVGAFGVAPGPVAAPTSGSAPDDAPSEDVTSSSYRTVANTVQKNLHGVDLPDDPTRPQDSSLEGMDTNKGALDPLDDPEGTEEAETTGEQPEPVTIRTTRQGDKVTTTLRASVPQVGPPARAQAPTPSSEAPAGPSTTPSAAAISMIDIAWDPQPSQLMVLTGAIISSGLVMYLAGPATSSFRSAAGGLRRALRGLFVLPLLVRIKSHQAIEDPKRRVLYNLIDENPGISTKELCEAADMSRSAVEHHLIVVARAGLVVSESIGRGRHYFPAAEFLDRRQMRARALLRADRNREILEAVERNPGITLTHLVKACGLHASQTHQALESLHGAGLVQRQRAGTSVQYRVAAEPAHLLA